MIYNLVVIFVYAGCVIFCHVVAKKRGLKPAFWGAMGLLFGPLAIPFVCLARPGNTN